MLYDDENVFIKRVGKNRFRAVGKTQGGRFLTIFYDLMEKELGRVVTAREPKDYEKKGYRELH